MRGHLDMGPFAERSVTTQASDAGRTRAALAMSLLPENPDQEDLAGATGRSR